MKKLMMLITITFLSFCIPKKIPNLIPMALMGSVPQPKPYTLEDIGLTEDAATSSGQAPTSGLPLISQAERDVMKQVILEYADAGLMTKEYWENSAKESMNLLAEEGLSSDQMTEYANLVLEGKETPTPARASKEEVTKRETVKAEEYFSLVREKLPELTKEQLIVLRQNLTVNLAIIRLQTDYNPVDGMPVELLTAMRDKNIGFRKEVTKEMEKRGITSL